MIAASSRVNETACVTSSSHFTIIVGCDLLACIETPARQEISRAVNQEFSIEPVANHSSKLDLKREGHNVIIVNGDFKIGILVLYPLPKL